jgi:hypothetical protein
MATYGIDSCRLGGLARARTAKRDKCGRFLPNELKKIRKS